MILDSINVRREPDIQVILNTNRSEFTENAMIGPADICIEVVSPESVKRDHGIKFDEYQQAGVREYWIVDPIRSECRLYRLNDDGIYIAQQPDSNGIYQTPLLPRFQLLIATLWQPPGMGAAMDAVREMLRTE